MSKNKHGHNTEPVENDDIEFTEVNPADNNVNIDDNLEAATERDETESLKDQLDKAIEANESMKKDYMFLMAEFDNFKKRTLKEKSELLKMLQSRL